MFPRGVKPFFIHQRLIAANTPFWLRCQPSPFLRHTASAVSKLMYTLGSFIGSEYARSLTTTLIYFDTQITSFSTPSTIHHGNVSCVPPVIMSEYFIFGIPTIIDGIPKSSNFTALLPPKEATAIAKSSKLDIILYTSNPQRISVQSDISNGIGTGISFGSPFSSSPSSITS